MLGWAVNQIILITCVFVICIVYNVQIFSSLSALTSHDFAQNVVL